ncbi:hypothetical protein SAMN05421774_11221 [Gemmobacter megaterium]|uniref:Uncharacterized protein n=1 Tax=Gemmobacter megaterium TaxID=1086013 RepID=A0A1N7QI79_9RHOB|nr:hypothetical protein [Gemmobacter megaterium]GGE26844.1 hypothetical protein GCM10011345_36060 [Gemmobacter megaterium]SIT22573.1 hypothetical protein SAMN05421774_11221 [Gemmobacter megaterium]
MGKRATFTGKQISAAVAAARAADPRAVIEIITQSGTIRILPESTPEKPADEVEAWFGRDDG